ncbi:MAG TPA: response regulator [Myxococcaceae bacterium]|jgi:DNA-binding NtrC family response regulator|nr:response regulator [Myxococcaceae bacterium]
MNPDPRTVLVVDDEENVVNALRRTLRREGYTVLSASEPSEALAVLRQARVDVVLSDQLMPNRSGLDFLKEVRALHPEVVRIMLTGHAEVSTAVEAINDGEIYRFLTKPWDDAELKVALHLAFDRIALERANRQLLATVEQQRRMLARLERAHPGLRDLLRDESGALLVDLDDRATLAFG